MSTPSTARPIALVGAACRYAGAASPEELWAASVAGRRAFRRMPAERLRLQDYAGRGPDSIDVEEVAVLEDWSFDRVGFRVAGPSHRAVDLTHWLALEVAASALADAGFRGREELPKEATGVLVGNSLAGEFSRAQQMRLRWPYVRRSVGAALAQEGWEPEALESFLGRLETAYKEPFPEPGEETLAGGLSNTIAGRIANYFDLGGGGYTLDGACASSLLAVANACSALAVGDLEVALVGGVDLSLDPFELVGFSRVGAFAEDRMRVFDERSAGFLPGEGCGFVVLMDLEAARERGLRVHTVIRGWGISSDGSGGLTRPELTGQLLALERAYRRAGFGPETTAYFECHGTGTAVGDPVELATLTRARRAGGTSGHPVPPAAVGSVKAVIGHTKAAAGVAGLIRATEALKAEVVPPAVGCEQPHPLLSGEDGGPPALRAPHRAEPWPQDVPLRVGVSAMGFGGINVHLVLEGPGRRTSTGPDRRRRSRTLPARVRVLDASRQDAELLVLEAPDAEELAVRAEALAAEVEELSYAELGDLAGELAKAVHEPRSSGVARGAVVATRPVEAALRLRDLAERARGGGAAVDPAEGVFLRTGRPTGRPPRIGFLFPGQGSPVYLNGGAWEARFEEVEAVWTGARESGALPETGDRTATEVAQPAIVASSVAAVSVLERLGIEASVAVGHSLGEYSALHWSGRLDAGSAIRLARARGDAMARLEGGAGAAPKRGAMVSIGCNAGTAEELVSGTSAVLAAINGPRQTVVSGPSGAVADVERRARARELEAVRLNVSYAFHSPLMAEAAPDLMTALTEVSPGTAVADRHMVSTVTGEPLPPDAELSELLVRQLTEPVRFEQAIERVDPEVELWIEVGPGRVLGGLLGALCPDGAPVPVVALDAGGSSLVGVLQAVAAAYVLGAPVALEELFADRSLRPLSWRDRPTNGSRFLRNPCEEAPLPVFAVEQDSSPAETVARGVPVPEEPVEAPDELAEDLSTVEVLRRLVARRVELPESAVTEGSRMLSDLHLSSITVGQLVGEAARLVGARAPIAPTDYANASLAEVAAGLDEQARAGGEDAASAEFPPGVDSWVRPFVGEWVERPVPSGGSAPETPPVVVHLPPEPDPEALRSLLEAGRRAIADPAAAFVLVHRGWGSGFARSLHLERATGTTLVVGLPAAGAPEDLAEERLHAELAAVQPGAYGECAYDAEGHRREPVLRLLPEAPPAGETLLESSTGGVILVSGGGRGIAAECALALARQSGAALALLGRSQPEESPELATNLERLRAAGVRFAYRAVDVTDPQGTAEAVESIEAELGPVTAVVHGAGRNRPRLIAALTDEDVAATLAPKIDGLRNVLAAVSPGRLRFLVAFGSIIARTGMAGEADYALANEILARDVERFSEAHAGCRCHVVEWSVWSGVGMGERLGTLESLGRQGISPIPPERGIEALRRLLAHPRAPVRVVVAGRFGAPPTVLTDRPELPFLRFLERPRFHVPGVELVVEVDVVDDSDPYLDDHVYDGERLFPAVLGLEAMAQSVAALLGQASAGPPAFRNVRFERPVILSADGRLTLRIAALRRTLAEGGGVDVVLRSSETGFQVDHFRGVCELPAESAGETEEPAPAGTQAPEPVDGAQAPVDRGRAVADLDPERDLYGSLLFHGGRFRRLAGYRSLRSRACVADIEAGDGVRWFGRYLPGTLLLGDPGARDAAIHAVQACIPHSTILPTSVERLTCGFLDPESTHTVEAEERSGDAEGEYVYDLVVRDEGGRVVERWEGLGLRAVRDGAAPSEWPAPLLVPYLERRIVELQPVAALAVQLEPEPTPGGRRRATSDRAIQAVASSLGENGNGAGGRSVWRRVLRRPDGRPEVAEGEPGFVESAGGRPPAVTASHAAGLVLAVAGTGPLGCDAEPVTERSGGVWLDLLGSERFALAERLAREAGEDADTAATRVWTAVETLRKAGLPADAPLILDRVVGRDPDRPVSRLAGERWVMLRSGCFPVSSLVTRIRGAEEPLALAFLVRSEEC